MPKEWGLTDVLARVTSSFDVVVNDAEAVRNLIFGLSAAAIAITAEDVTAWDICQCDNRP